MHKKKVQEGESFRRGIRDGFCRGAFPMGQLIRGAAPRREDGGKAALQCRSLFPCGGGPQSNVYGADSLLDK